MDKKGARFLWTRNEHTVYVQERSTLSMDTKGARYLSTRMEHTVYGQEWRLLYVLLWSTLETKSNFIYNNILQ